MAACRHKETKGDHDDVSNDTYALLGVGNVSS